MAQLKHDLHRQLTLVRGTNPVATASSAQTGATFDRGAAGVGKGSNSLAVVFYFGLYTDGQWTPKLEESDDNSAWTDVAAADVIGTLSTVTSTSNDNVIQACSYNGSKRYVRGSLVETSNGTTGIVYACMYIGAGGAVNSALEAA